MHFWVMFFVLFIAVNLVPDTAAIESASAVRERQIREARGALNAGVASLQAGKFDDAIVQLNNALKNERALNPENKTVALYARGIAYFNKNDCAATMADFDRIAESKANEGQYHYIRSACLEKAGDKAGSEAALAKAIEVAPDNLQYVRHRCISRFNAKDYGNAIPDCERVVVAKPDDADVWLALGQAYDVINQKEKALNAYRKLLALKPDSKPAQDGIKRLGG